MKPIPTLKQLEYLVALAEHRHFGKAAAACFVTQSTLSAGLRDLETLLDARLVERDRRSVALLPIGEEVVARARAVLREAEGLVELARARTAPLSGTVRLGVIPTVGPFLLPRVLPGLRRDHPDLRLYLREDLTDRLVADLRRGALDVALLALPCDCGPIRTEILFDDPFLLACPPGHRLAAAGPLGEPELAGEPLLLLEEGHCLREHALDACRLGAGGMDDAFAATSLHTLVQMVANGLGVTLLPRLAVDAGILAGTGLVDVPFADPQPVRRIGLVWRGSPARDSEFRLLARALAAGA